MGERVIKLPDVGEGVAEAELVEWRVKVGDVVREDTMLAAVMTDKATVEIPSPVDGEVTWLGAEAGQTVAVGSPIVRLRVADKVPPPPPRPAPERPRAPPPPPRPVDPILARLTAPLDKTPPQPGTAEAVLALLNSPADPFSIEPLDWSLDPKPKAEPETPAPPLEPEAVAAPSDDDAAEQSAGDSAARQAETAVQEPAADLQAASDAAVPAEEPGGVESAPMPAGTAHMEAEAAAPPDPVPPYSDGPSPAPSPEPAREPAGQPAAPLESINAHDELDAVLAAVKAAAAARLPGARAEPEPAEQPAAAADEEEAVAASMPEEPDQDFDDGEETPVADLTPPGVPRPEGEKPLASPAVRLRAREAGVDLRRVRGSGPAGQIGHADLDAFIAGSDAAQAAPRTGLARNTAVEDIRIIGLRRKIADKMRLAKSRIPHITYIEEIDVTALEDLRAALNKDRRPGRAKLTLIPFLMRAMVKAIAGQPGMNALFDDEAGIVHRHGAVHIGVAAQTEAGLVVPVVKHAEARDLWDCAAEVERLAEAARAGSATREELTGSTITLTSLGALGGVATTPVINHPEVAIVGVNKIVVRPVWDGAQFLPRKVMNLSSSFDHRVVDGWDAAVFIQRIKALLESPAMIFIDD